jgi:hypothetical protein
MKLDQPASIDCPQQAGRDGREDDGGRADKATASQPNAAARSAHSPGQAKNLLQSDKNWRQQCGGRAAAG